jgi:hypothetical protein
MHPPLEISVGAMASPSQSSFRKPVLTKGKDSYQARGDNPEAGDKKNVSFLKRVKIKKIRSYKLYSKAECDATWHNDEEYAAIKKGCIRTLREMMKPGFKECEEICPRGLEVRTREASAARKEIRTMASQLVLEEQDLQTEWGEKNDDRIREAYLSISQEAHYRSHFRGLGDEQTANGPKRSVPPKRSGPRR